jgi:hypothetical protein
MSRSIHAPGESLPYNHHLHQFRTFLKHERGFADATIVNREPSRKPFLGWLVAGFGIGDHDLGLVFFAVHILNTCSHLGAAWLARRIGLVNTMVFTHLPSSLFLMAVPFAP